MEFLWLLFPKATFVTFRCPASSKRASFRVLRGLKSRVKFSLLKTHPKHPANCNFLSLFSNWVTREKFMNERI